MQLSQNRAEQVVRALREQGVFASMLKDAVRISQWQTIALSWGVRRTSESTIS
ncbi:hypothetical protein [Stenotrophomonas maltophilia group sp. CASM26]|uniref:hypothetical protein n=1 Tax=Stenotrophomonas TaxID=40323 RepID=UPI003BF7DD04